MQSLNKRLEEKLQVKKTNGSFRRLTINDHLIDFSSNDYLGLARNGALQEQSQKLFESYNAASRLNGSTGSRLITGNTTEAENLENYLSTIFDAENTLIFNSGYTANLAILSTIPQRGDTIFYDESIHASLKDGARLSFAQRISFHHNNLEDLENKLKRGTGQTFVVAESLYSMDGDFCPLEDTIKLCKKYNSHLILDEAHTTGILGKKGAGMAVEKNLHHDIFARIYTFGKAVGAHGACIASSRLLKDYLVNFARPFIYTTALPLHAIAGIHSAFNYLTNHMAPYNQLLSNIHYYKNTNCISEVGQHWLGNDNNYISPIQTIPAPGNKEAINLSLRLQAQGIYAKAILSPTVQAGQERIRVCLHAFNTHEEIDLLKTTIAGQAHKKKKSSI